MTLERLRDLFSGHEDGIRRRLLWIGLTCLAVALLTNTLAGYFYTARLIKKDAAELQMEVASWVATQIEDFIKRRIERLSDLSVSMSIYELGSKEQRLLSLLLLKNATSFTETSILDENGMEVVKVSERKVYLPTDFTDQSTSEKFKQAIKGESYISPVYTSDKAEPYVTVAVPIRLSAKQIIGVLSVETNLRSLWEIVGDVAFGKAGYAYLVDSRGRLIAHRDPSEVLKGRSLSSLSPVMRFRQAPLSSDISPGAEVQGLYGRSVLATYAPVPRVGWAVIVEEPVAAALADLKKMQLYAGALLVVGLLLGTTIIVWVSDKITRPIRELHRGADVIGRGNLDYRVEIEAKDEIGELAQKFNNMAAELKTSYTTLEQKVEQRTRELTALYSLAKTVSQSLNVDEILSDFTNKITELIDIQKVGIFLVNRETNRLSLRAQKGMREERVHFLATTPFEEAFIGQAARLGTATYVGDLWTDPGIPVTMRENLTRQGARSVAVFPLKSKGKVLGILSVGHKDPDKLTAHDLSLLGSFADQLAVAIENASLFGEVKDKSRQLESLIKINRDVAALMDRETLLPRIAEEAKKILGVERATFRLIEGSQLVQAGYAGHSAIGILPQKTDLNESLIGRIAREGRAVAIRNVFEDQRLTEAHRDVMRDSGYHSYLGVPLKVGNDVIGLISLYTKEEREFLPKEIEVMTAFTDQAAIAIQNANLFAEIKKNARDLEIINRELEEANRIKSDFMAAMSHELRTPMNVIIGNAQLMEDGFFGPVEEKQKEAIEKMLRYAQVLLKLINDVLTLTRIEAKKMSLDVSTFQIDEVITEVQTYVAHANGNHKVEINWNVESNLPTMSTDALKLEEILQNLIGNALKFTPEGKIEISVRNLPKKERIECTVSDTGMGIEQSDLEKIFEQFYQLKEAHTGGFSGVGLGLSIVKTYLELMQGEIQVESEPGIGSTFTFQLPYALSIGKTPS